MDKRLGKIAKIKFGFDSDKRFGLHFEFTGNGWGVNWFEGLSENKQPMTIHSEAYQLVFNIQKYLGAAKCYTVSQLEGKPVEVTIEDGLLRQWRILDEVL